MTDEYLIAIITAVIIFALPLLILCIFLGVKLCQKNNALGIVLLVIPLNVFGLILGMCLLYNYRHQVVVKTPIDQLEAKIKDQEIISKQEPKPNYELQK